MTYKSITYLRYSQEYEVFCRSSIDGYAYHKYLYDKNYDLIFEQYLVRSNFVYNNNRPSQINYKNGIISQIIVSNMKNHYHNDNKNIPAVVRFNKNGEIIHQEYWNDAILIRTEDFYGMDY